MKITKKDLNTTCITALAYLAAIAYAASEDSAFMCVVSTIVFAIWLYACWIIHQEQDRRHNMKDNQNKKISEAMADLEQWRKKKEAD